MSNRWSNQPRPATSGRHDPTPEQALAFQTRTLMRDFQQQRGRDQTATIERVLAILVAELRRRDAWARNGSPQRSGARCAVTASPRPMYDGLRGECRAPLQRAAPMHAQGSLLG